jgi:hypothetical protein
MRRRQQAERAPARQRRLQGKVVQHRHADDGVVRGLGQRIGQQVGLPDGDARFSGLPGSSDMFGVPVHRVHLVHAAPQLGGEQPCAAAGVEHAL